MVEIQLSKRCPNRMMFSYYFTGDLDGNLYLVKRHIPEYRIVCQAPDGIAFDTLSLDLPAVEKTEDEIALEKQHIEEYLTGVGTSNVVQWIYEPDTFRAPIDGMWLGWEGNLWCRDFIAVHENEGMVQRILLIDAEYP